MVSLNVTSIFSGAGGLDLGLEQAGHNIRMVCEINKDAQAVLGATFPNTILKKDVKSLFSLPADTDLLAAGFPCIDISRVGLRRGLKGSSSGMVHEIFRLLRQAFTDHKPVPWVLLENVEALLDSTHGQPPPIKNITDELQTLGYSWAYRVICSASFGLPNRRRRVFILASLHGDPRDVLLTQGRQRCAGGCLRSGDRNPCYECYEPPIQYLNGVDPLQAQPQDISLDECSLALDLGNARSGPGIDIAPTFTTHNGHMCIVTSDGRAGYLSIEDAESIQGLPPGYTLPCQKGDRARFKLIGNAVTVHVARWLGMRLSHPYELKYVTSSSDCCQTRTSTTFHKCGWWLKGVGRHTVSEMSMCPLKLPYQRLGSFILRLQEMPTTQPLTVYLMRLREAGYNIDPIIRKIQGTDVNLHPNVVSVVRLHHKTTVCWARDREEGLWWPAGVLDPFASGTTVSDSIARLLSERERTLYVPQAVSVSHLPPQHRKVFVTFLGKEQSLWVWLRDICEYQPCRQEMIEQMEASIHVKLSTTSSLFKRAVSLADATCQTDVLTPDVAISYRSGTHFMEAAEQASKIKQLERCGSCRTCLQPDIHIWRKHCLFLRMKAAAAGGHAGAQLAALGEACVGAKIRVWWPLDAAWYTGWITAYDNIHITHRVVYEDGEAEQISLWAAGQLISPISPQNKWPAAQQAIQACTAAVKRQKSSNVNALLSQSTEQKTLTEQQRDARIQENQLRLNSILN